ncbi:MAG TPA: sigma-70 family RNA polymerase sigma factor [Chitinophagaceae bacterium]|jgi:RNA polymerase sigma-70 factor (ECF subfamily)|nr:sigma-70 family RNA polymerase sigma factor [Chitinophagaceae bacterium]
MAAADEAAFARLFDHHRNRVYSIAYKISGSSQLAEEVVQDVFLKIWLKRTELAGIRNFNAYLCTMVQHAVYKALKQMAASLKRTAPESAEAFALTPGPETQLVDKEYQLLLHEAVEQLPAQQRQVYRLIREKGLRRSEVAELLNLQPDTVKFHLAKAMKNVWQYCQLHLHLFIGFVLAQMLPLLLSL